MRKASNYGHVKTALADRADFKHTSCDARTVTPDLAPGAGRLDQIERDHYFDALAEAREQGLPVYVVRSYATPIAWKVGEAPTYHVAQRFSTTTSKQQTYVRCYLV